MPSFPVEIIGVAPGKRGANRAMRNRNMRAAAGANFR
jgi:hypothetical protein